MRLRCFRFDRHRTLKCVGTNGDLFHTRNNPNVRKYCQSVGDAMEEHRIWDVVARVYYNVKVALWALLITSVIFLAFQLPRLSAISAAIAATRAAEVAAENAGYCERLGMKAVWCNAGGRNRANGRCKPATITAPDAVDRSSTGT